MKNCSCSHIENNYYLFNYFDDTLKDIGAAVDIDFSKKYMRLQDIKKILSETKKWSFSQEKTETIYALELVDITRFQVRISIILM